MKAAPVLTVLAMALLLPLPLHAQYLTPPTRLGSLVPIKVQSLAPGIEADPGYSLSYRADEDEAFAWKPGGIGALIGAGVGLGLSLVINDPEGKAENGAGYYVGFTVIGALVGFFTGAVIGNK